MFNLNVLFLILINPNNVEDYKVLLWEVVAIECAEPLSD